MSQSAHAVFHYTGCFDHLANILANGFYPSYCKETIHRGTFIEEYAIPMVSFCDIPLSQVKDHIEKYGPYAIGLSLNWAVQNHLNPVQYLESNSALNEGVNGIFWFLMQDWHEILEDNQFDEFYEKAYKGGLAVLGSIKPYEGLRKRKDGQTVLYKFYNEREWRYTPRLTIDHIPEYEDIFWQDCFDDLKKRFPTKPHFNILNLNFTTADIKYLIVKTEQEIPSLIEFLRSQPKFYGNKEEFQILLTKILTHERIENDF